MNLSPPPNSLTKLFGDLNSVQIDYILNIRNILLSLDEQLCEQGFSTRTLYGLEKRERQVFKTKVCAEFIPELRGLHRPRLRLRLPYPKLEFGEAGHTFKSDRVKGLCWVEPRHKKIWHPDSPIRLYFFLSKSQRYSYVLSPNEYEKIYQKLTGRGASFQILRNFIDAAYFEWKMLIQR